MVVKGEKKDALKFLKQFHMKLAEFLAVIDRVKPMKHLFYYGLDLYFLIGN